MHAFDGWSAALGAPIIGVISNFVDKDWFLKCIPVALLNIGDASKSGIQQRALIYEIVRENDIIGSDMIRNIQLRLTTNLLQPLPLIYSRTSLGPFDVWRTH